MTPLSRAENHYANNLAASNLTSNLEVCDVYLGNERSSSGHRQLLYMPGHYDGEPSFNSSQNGATVIVLNPNASR